MRLRYVGGEKHITVNWKDSPDPNKPEFTVFDPEGETSDERGQRLLDNPKYNGKFVKVEPPKPAEPKPTFTCDVCGEVKKSKAGLGAHKRKHKEQQ